MNPFDKILIKTPKSSRFDQHNTNKLTMPAGKLVPIWWKDITPNEQVKLSLSSLVKTMPMVAPIFDRLKLETFAFFVPYRLVWDRAEDFFNLSTPIADRPPMPKISGYFGPKSYWVNNNAQYDTLDQKGDLMDYLGYPLFNNYITHYLQYLLDQNDVYSTICEVSYSNSYYFMPYFTSGGSDIFVNVTNDWWSIKRLSCPWLSDNTQTAAFTFSNKPSDNSFIMSFTMWIYQQLLEAFGLIDYTSSSTEFHTRWTTTPDQLGLIRDMATFDHPATISSDDLYSLALQKLPYSNLNEMKLAYNKYLFARFIEVTAVDSYSEFKDFFAQTTTGTKLRGSLLRSSLTKRVYWRIVADWFVNSNFVDVDDIISNYAQNDYSETITPDAYHLANRYWENDYFTSAFASTQSGTDVPIPVNGSIKDLRNSNTLQRVMELVLYSGKRYIDQIRTFFNAHSSDSRLDRAEVLGKSDFVFGIDEITQMSESNPENPLGSFAGRALTAGSDNMFHYHAEEHGMIMILASIKPMSSYIGITDRFYFKDSPYDFLIPQFANVGEQEIYADELQQRLPNNLSDIGIVFGYQRRYAEYMFKHNEVHGEFIDSMDFWTMARKFYSLPVLNEDFLQITDSDNLNRAFAVPSSKGNFCCYFSFTFKDVNALPRFLKYDL